MGNFCLSFWTKLRNSALTPEFPAKVFGLVLAQAGVNLHELLDKVEKLWAQTGVSGLSFRSAQSSHVLFIWLSFWCK